MRNASLREHANTSDVFLDAAWEGRERDAVPAEPPMTDEEIDAMYADFCATKAPGSAPQAIGPQAPD